MKGTVVFCCKSKYPSGSAFAIYSSSICSAYKNAGYDTVCIGQGDTSKNIIFEDYFGKYVSVRGDAGNFFEKAFNQLRLDKKVYSYLIKNFKNVDYIFIDSTFPLHYYKKIARHYQTAKKFIILAEEYEQDEFEKLSFLMRRELRRNKRIINKFSDKRFGFITISKYLFFKMKNKGFDCQYIPFVFSKIYFDRINQKKRHDKINYIYSGNPQNKDNLYEVLVAFSKLPSEVHNKIRLNLIGITKEWLLKKPNGLDVFSKISNFTVFLGTKSHQFVEEMLLCSDYSVLLRDPDKIFTKAGFPTKVVESMIFGVTPICNLSSNLEDYLNDKNSIIVQGNDAESFKSAILKSLMPRDKIELLNQESKETALKHFIAENYISIN